MDEHIPPWRPYLRAARQQEGRSPSSRWLQLATVAADGTPRVRTVVFRGWSGPSQLDLLSDGRSEKVGELHGQPALELCWLLAKARCQFRLRGKQMVLEGELHDDARQTHWQQLSPQARSLWGWPQPGANRTDEHKFVSAMDDGAAIPEHFVLIRVAIEQVELLELKPFPHRRRLWRANRAWLSEELNP